MKRSTDVVLVAANEATELFLVLEGGTWQKVNEAISCLKARREITSEA